MCVHVIFFYGHLFINMENEKIVTPIPLEMIILKPNSSLEESKFIGNNAAEDFFGLPAVKKEDTEVFHGPDFSTDLQIVEKKINPSNAASMNSDHAINSILKVEPGNEYFEMENDPLCIPRNTDTSIRRTEILKVNASIIPVVHSSECKQVFPNQKELVTNEINESKLSYDITLDDLKIKKEELYIKEDPLKKETGDEEIFPNKPIVKIENCEAWNESEQVPGVLLKDWKIKNEEVDIEEEDLKIEISMAPSCGQKKQNNNQRMHHQNIRKHKLQDKKPVEGDVFRCDQCDYQSNLRRNLRMHFFKHKKPEEVNMFKCDYCDYQTRWKTSIKIHLLRHNNLTNLFKCDQCDYETNWKTNLNLHRFRHKNPEEVKMFKCDQCDYQSLRKGHFNRHLLSHKDPKDVNMFKCDQCDYHAIRKSSLKAHLIRHMDTKDIQIFKCDQCDFDSIYKRNLRSHLLKHKNPKDVNMFKCDQCDYQSIQKCNFKRHFLTHKNPKDVTV